MMCTCGYPAREGQGTGVLRDWTVEGGGFDMQVSTLDLSTRKLNSSHLDDLVGPLNR
jgi:hypothetical protein